MALICMMHHGPKEDFPLADFAASTSSKMANPLMKLPLFFSKNQPIPPSQPDCPLLQLPPELRIEIYRLVLLKSTPTERLQLRELSKPAIASTCRQLQSETLEVFFRENYFEMTVFCNRKWEIPDTLHEHYLWAQKLGHVAGPLRNVVFRTWEFDLVAEEAIRILPDRDRESIPENLEILELERKDLNFLVAKNPTWRIAGTDWPKIQHFFDSMPARAPHDNHDGLDVSDVVVLARLVARTRWPRYIRWTLRYLGIQRSKALSVQLERVADWLEGLLEKMEKRRIERERKAGGEG